MLRIVRKQPLSSKSAIDSFEASSELVSACFSPGFLTKALTFTMPISLTPSRSCIKPGWLSTAEVKNLTIEIFNRMSSVLDSNLRRNMSLSA